MTLVEFVSRIVSDHVSSRVREAEEMAAYHKRQADTWRGIAAAMGYEPKAHLDVRPKRQWLMDRVENYRRLAAIETTSQPGTDERSEGVNT